MYVWKTFNRNAAVTEIDWLAKVLAKREKNSAFLWNLEIQLLYRTSLDDRTSCGRRFLNNLLGLGSVCMRTNLLTLKTSFQF